MIIARSFARIHETNLKVCGPFLVRHSTTQLTSQKQGILPLWFANKADYSKISAHDKVETVGLERLLSGDTTGGETQITLKVTKPSGEVVEFPTKHTMSVDQLEWLRAGSALNYIGEQARKSGKA